MSRWTASDKHREVCEAIGIENYWLRDARHTWAVRARQAGATEQFIANQLGHKTTAMVHKVYGRYSPNDAERLEWQRIAAAQDEAAARAAG
jgi:integrase